jgi:hypothetical protein
LPTWFSCKFDRSPYISCRGFRISRSRKLWNHFPRFLSFDLMMKILVISSSCTVLPLTFLQELFSLKAYRFCGKILCLDIVVGEYPMTWDNLQSSTCLIWNRFVTFYTSPIFQMLRKDITWLGIPYHGVISNRPDGALFSVKAAVSKALLLKGIMANLFMSSLILPCQEWFDYIFTDFPLAVVFREVQVMKPLPQLIRHSLNL